MKLSQKIGLLLFILAVGVFDIKSSDAIQGTINFIAYIVLVIGSVLFVND